jgi:hypothetical protein
VTLEYQAEPHLPSQRVDACLKLGAEAFVGNSRERVIKLCHE